MAENHVIEWDAEFPMRRIGAEFPEFAAWCINEAERMISDGGDAHDVLLNAIGSVSAYACGIPDEELRAWMFMLDYGTARMSGAIDGD